MIPGRATPAGTASLGLRCLEQFASDFHLPAWPGGLTLSGIGLGTYLGDADAATDRRYEETVQEALLAGVNLIDTAINYRAQRSERAVGRALARVLQAGRLSREQVVIATKGGFIPRDGDDPRRGASQLLHGIAPDEIIDGAHCLHPVYLARSIAQSRRNLGVETIDIYYLHNPETQLGRVSRAELHDRLWRAFAALESARTAGEISWYGTATWTGYLRPPNDPGALEMEQVVEAARAAGGEAHGLRFVQLPVSLALRAALQESTQRVGSKMLPALTAIHRLGLVAVASGALGQGKLARKGAVVSGVIAQGREAEPEGRGEGLTSAQRALRFVRSVGVGSALVGTSRVEHLREDLGAGRVPRLDLAAVRAAMDGTG